MNRDDLKKYINSLAYLSAEKKETYLQQVSSLDKNKIKQVYLALLEKSTNYYNSVSSLIKKEEKELVKKTESLHTQHHINKARKSIKNA
jgi:hypothetical protein